MKYKLSYTYTMQGIIKVNTKNKAEAIKNWNDGKYDYAENEIVIAHTEPVITKN